MILTALHHLCMYRALLIGDKTVSKTQFVLSLTHKDVYTPIVRTHKQTTRSVQYTFDIMRGIHMAHENEKLLYLALCKLPCREMEYQLAPIDSGYFVSVHRVNVAVEGHVPHIYAECDSSDPSMGRRRVG
jgi:hypothetical protein